MAKSDKRGLALEIAERRRQINELLPYPLHPGQSRVLDEIFLNNRKRILIVAGCSWGKTAVEMIAGMYMSSFPNKSSFIIGPSRKQQKEVMWEGADSIKNLVPIGFSPKFMESESRIEFPDWGSFIKIDGSENYDAFRGVAGDLWLFDEAQNVDFRFYDAIYPRLSKRDGALVVVGTMVRNLNNRFMQLWQEALKDPDWLVIHAPSSENPNPNVQKFLATEKEKYLRRGDHATWALEFDALYMPGGKDAVFQMYDPKRQGRPRDWFRGRLDKKSVTFYVSFDPGTTGSAFAVLLVAIDRDTAEVYVLDEVYETNKNNTTPRLMWEQTRRIEAKWMPKGRSPVRIYDEAAAWFEAQMASEFKIGLLPSGKTSRDKWDDIGYIKDALYADKFYINVVDCPKLSEEMLSYETDKDGELIKRNDHNIDNLRYIFRQSGYTMNPKEEALADGFMGESKSGFFEDQKSDGLGALRELFPW